MSIIRFSQHGMSIMSISSTQCKMARYGLGWKVEDLAARSGVMPGTISRFERGHKARVGTIDAIENAFLETGKIRFEGQTCVCVGE